ncbi:MAG: lipopolysaccharide biosynthesis protein [Novosphingobium sp.]
MARGARSRQRLQAKTPIGRMVANTAWLLGGKGFGALCGLVYLAILTRTLGLKGFGHFSLIVGTAQALIAIAGFQTWRVVVRYGAPHIHAGDWRNFGRLGMLCGLLDAVGAVVGCVIAYVVIYGFGDMLGINPAFKDTAFLFNCAMVMALVSAPTGIVRALDRFDMAVYVEAVVPTGRLLAAVAIWMTGPSVARFLFAWAAIDLIEAALYWVMARRLCPEAVRLRHVGEWREALRANPGVERFFLITYASSTLEALVRNGPLLAVGALVSTRAAGLYRLANQLTQAMSKLSTLLTRAVYAEVSRARVATAAEEFRKLAAQTSMIAAVAGALVVSIALAFGDDLLVLVGGAAFAHGQAILVPLAIAASFDLASVAFEPVLHSIGRARYALMARCAAVLALALALLPLIHLHKAVGAAWAVAIGGAVSYVAMGLMARYTLRRLDQGESVQAEAASLSDPRSEG